MTITDVVMHVDESPTIDEREHLKSAIHDVYGVQSAEFSAVRDHLMFVDYDSDAVKAKDILDQVNEHGYHAQLVAI